MGERLEWGVDARGDEEITFNVSRVLRRGVKALTPNPALPPIEGEGFKAAPALSEFGQQRVHAGLAFRSTY
jgi:hypothetical protein